MPSVQVWHWEESRYSLKSLGWVLLGAWPLWPNDAPHSIRGKNPLRPAACNNEIKGIESDFCLKQPRTPCYTTVLKAGQTNYFSGLSIFVSLDIEKKPWHMEIYVLSLCKKKLSCNKRPVLRASQWPNQWSHRVLLGIKLKTWTW